jgi:hypothetical protein
MKYKGYQHCKNGYLKEKVPQPSAATLGFKSQVCSRLKCYRTEHLLVFMVSSIHFSF